MLPPKVKAVQLIMAMATYQVWGSGDESASNQIERAKKQAIYMVEDKLQVIKKTNLFGLVNEQWEYWNLVIENIKHYNENLKLKK